MRKQSVAKVAHKNLSAVSWRSDNSNPASQEEDSKSSRVPSWRKLAAPPASLPPTAISPRLAIASFSRDKGGFYTISDTEKSSIKRPHIGAMPEVVLQESERYDFRKRNTANPPSAAALNRAVSYAGARPKSMYKQFCLPTDECDPIQTRAEANRGVKLTKANFKIGMIIRAPVHEQDFKEGRATSAAGSEATIAEKYTTESKFGTIFTKYRKMIVVALHQDNYVAIPMYTHNGKGLHNKARPDEFVSVKDHRNKDPKWSKLSEWDPLVTGHINPGIDLFDPKSTAHLAYPVSRKYNLPVVHEGQLRATSLSPLANSSPSLRRLTDVVLIRLILPREICD
ncbi:MAG: hypothetical protein LQ351_005997 [Letrouitia transgressa]|nr:MAG: hypothetical protein LQ351_005997 [Letrouitia transgressa]